MRLTPMETFPKAMTAVFIAGACLFPVNAAQSVPTGPEGQAEIHASVPNLIEHLDAAVRAREESVLGYTVQEHYSIFRNGEANPSAQMTLQVDYKQGTGKTYSSVSESGSALLRATVFSKILAGEKDMSQASVRDSVLVDSKNYEMHPEPGQVELNGRQCYVVDIKPRRASPHLFNGKAWIDSTDYFVVRLEGIPSKSLSFMSGETTVARDYIQIDGFPMASRAEAHSHSFLFGDTVLKIEYSGYQIQRDTASAHRP